MTHADPLTHARTFPWTLRDILLIAAALALLVGITALVAGRERWISRSGASALDAVPIATLTSSDFHSLAFDPRDPNVVFFGHHQGVLKSTDAGRTWTSVLRAGDAMSLVALDNELVLAGHEVFERADSAGSMWNNIGTNLPDQDIHGFAISPGNPSTFFARVVNYGLWRSDDAGLTWRLVSNGLPETVLALAVVPTTLETLYAGTMDRGLLKSVDAGMTWKSVNSLNMKTVVSLAQHPRDPRVLFAATEGGLFRSDSDGTAWTRVGLAGQELAAVAISRPSPARILVVDMQGRVYRSDDGGASWGAK